MFSELNIDIKIEILLNIFLVTLDTGAYYVKVVKVYPDNVIVETLNAFLTIDH